MQLLFWEISSFGRFLPHGGSFKLDLQILGPNENNYSKTDDQHDDQDYDIDDDLDLAG